MGNMNEKEKGEAWVALQLAIEKHGLKEKVEKLSLDADGNELPTTTVLFLVKEEMLMLGETQVAGIIDEIIKEVVCAKSCCGERCDCGDDKEEQGRLGSDEVDTAVEATEVGEANEIDLKDVPLA